MSRSKVEVRRTPVRIVPDHSRVLVRPFFPGSPERITRIVHRILSLSDEDVKAEWREVSRRFRERHFDLLHLFERHYKRATEIVPLEEPLKGTRRHLLGAYFTSEYSLQSAALFNPSMIPHPDQTGLPEGWIRFVMSLRATGEGHVSSIEFRSGVVDHRFNIAIDPVSRYVAAPELHEETEHDRTLLKQKMVELKQETTLSKELLGECNDTFTLEDLEKMVWEREQMKGGLTVEETRAADVLTWVARSRHELHFHKDQLLSERIIFPITADESGGIEDARFVKFTDEDGSVTYYATYTAYNGRVILPQLLETHDFLRFRVSALYGNSAKNKGMAIFPRKINGEYVAITREDGESLFIAYSDNVYIWQNSKPLLCPEEPWEMIQIGNCGSPIETEAGWLLITHGVGAMRRYCLGAVLLDLNDPSKVIGRLKEPLLEPNENEREGYVPNVVYTCGAMLHKGELILPYAMSDSATSIATIPIDEILSAMEPRSG